MWRELAVGKGRHALRESSNSDGGESRRVPLRELDAAVAITNFDEVILGYTREEAITEARRADSADLRPAAGACRLGVNIPAFVDSIASGDFDRAKAIITQAHQWPKILGRWCSKPCETAHELGPAIEPLFISALERAAAEYGHVESTQSARAAKPLRVAILGAGSGGSAAAYRLRERGHEVVMYDHLPVTGGMMSTGYPEFRLPLTVVQEENDPTQWGATVELGVEIDRELFERVRREYDVVIVATGKVKEARLGIPGDGARGVWDALDFLARIKLGRPAPIGRVVAVFGAGYSAQDASRAARRMGSTVRIYYRRSAEEMPVRQSQRDRYIARQAAEGAPYVFQVAPLRVLTGPNDEVTGVECVRTIPGKPDASRRSTPLPVRGSEFVITCDTVITATGESMDVSYLPADVRLTETGSLWVDPATSETSLPGVYAVGAAAGRGSTDDAFASGFLTAEAIVSRRS